MSTDRPTPLEPAPPSMAELRAQAGWARLARRLRSVSPGDLARAALTTLVAAAVLGLAVASWPALRPFVLGAFLVYLLLPIVNGFAKVMPRALAALVTLAGFAAGVGALLYAMAPALTVQVQRLYNTTLNPEVIADYVQRLDRVLLDVPEPAQSLLRAYFERVNAALQAQLETIISALATTSVTSGLALVNTLSALLGLVLLPLWMLAMMIAQPSAGAALRRALPDWAKPDVFALLRIVDRALGTFVRGQLVLGIAVGLVIYLEIALVERFTTFDARYPVLIALLAGLLQLIPQLGPLLGVVVFGLLGLGISPQAALLIVAMYTGAQVLVANLVAPHLQRRLTDLNPVILVLLLAVLSNFGVVWVLLSAPILAVARDVLRYAYGRLADQPRQAGPLPGEPRAQSATRRAGRTAVAPASRAAARRGTSPR